MPVAYDPSSYAVRFLSSRPSHKFFPREKNHVISTTTRNFYSRERRMSEMKGKRREIESSNLSFFPSTSFSLFSLFFFFFSWRHDEGSSSSFRIFTYTHAWKAGSFRGVGVAPRARVKEGGNTVWCVGMRIGTGGGGRGGPRPSRKFPRPARFRCPVHIITVLRIPAPEIVRALVALRALLSHFLPIFSRRPPSPELPAKLPHRRRIIVVHTGIRIIRADSMTNTLHRAWNPRGKNK